MWLLGTEGTLHLATLHPVIESAAAVRGTCVRAAHLHISNLIERKTHLSHSAVFYSKQNKILYLQMESLLSYGQNCEIPQF